MLAPCATPAAAQTGSIEARLRSQREDLDRIRRERDSLEARVRQLQGTSRDNAAEAKNYERLADLTQRALNAAIRQLRGVTEDLDSASGKLVRNQDELIIKRAALQHRLVDIYKRGPLYSFEALLSAQSFGELIARYKYLRVLAERDRADVRRYAALRDSIASNRDELVTLQNEVEVDRTQKADEEDRLRALERQWEQRAATTQRNAQAVQQQLQRAVASEKRVTNAINALVAEARRPGARAGAPPPTSGSMRNADRGTLDWPVDGDIIYSFGRLENPNNTVIRWNGIGIGATQGAPVRAIADGIVRIAEPMGTFGNTIVIQHGENYSLYGSLARMMVGKGETVTKGQQIGTVGLTDPELGPHLHFQIHDADGHPVDPLDWLRSKQQ